MHLCNTSISEKNHSDYNNQKVINQLKKLLLLKSARENNRTSIIGRYGAHSGDRSYPVCE